MTTNQYDAIVVGARCAGSPTAMLLARRGYKVLVVDKAKFPSDTISTHLVHPPGVAALRKWGLIDELVATGCPAIDTYDFDMGPFTLSGHPGTLDEPVSYGPRRTVLDKLLVDAAIRAGAEVREGFIVEEVVFDNGSVTGIRGHDKGGKTVTEQTRVVIGADGRHSLVAREVKSEQYNEKPPLLAGYYSYWSGVPLNNRFEAYDRGNRSFAAWPTNDDLTLIVGGDDVCAAFMDIQPVNPGHLLVVPLEHHPYLADIDDETAGHLMRVAHRLSAALRASDVRCEGVNLFLADGEAAMQEVFHVHLHVFPRYAGDGFGLRFGADYRNRPPREELDRIAAELKKIAGNYGGATR